MSFLQVRELRKDFDLSGGSLARLLTGTRTLKAVDGVSFTVAEGQTLGLVGESGCGKSTTARLITRLIPATSGEVYLEGREILTLPKNEVRAIRRRMQMVFQDPYASLNPRMKVSDTIGRSLTIYGGMKGKRRTEEVERLLQLVGLQADHLHRYPHELSGGQRQRVAIARALSTEPKLLIADEPVSALDLSVQAQVLNLFRKLQKELKLTMLFISHDLNVIQYIADFVAVMYAGKIMELGAVRQVFERPLHPYTKGLIASNMGLGVPNHKEHQLRGEIVLPINPGTGCRLESRCPIKVERCKSIEPLLEEKTSGRRVACHET
jgi:oligopeptide/dipeptide ABC transporter ATP-binding protein